MKREKNLFAGCYGADLLSAVLILGAGILLLLILLLRGGAFALFALIPVTFAVLRIFSHDAARREAENAAFVGLLRRARSTVRLLFCRFRDRKTHLYFRCALCERVLRVRRNVGEITVACPHCKTALRLDTGCEQESKTETEVESN